MAQGLESTLKGSLNTPTLSRMQSWYAVDFHTNNSLFYAPDQKASHMELIPTLSEG